MISLSVGGLDMKIRFAFLLLIVGLIATVSSCSKRSLNALNPCTINGVVQNVPVNPQRALDLLIVIDDSPSMRDEQEKLQEQVPRLVNLLITGGAAEPEAVGEFPAVESLHVGIITPDMGYSTFPMTDFIADVDFNPTDACKRNGGLGLAGNMQTESSRTPAPDDCPTTITEGTQYINFPEAGFDAQDLIDDVTCLTGQDFGCGFEQQLEAILASDRAPGNAGFNREDALLAVILITDEDDCSTTDPRVFDVEARESNPFQGPFIVSTMRRPGAAAPEPSVAMQAGRSCCPCVSSVAGSGTSVIASDPRIASYRASSLLKFSRSRLSSSGIPVIAANTTWLGSDLSAATPST